MKSKTGLSSCKKSCVPVEVENGFQIELSAPNNVKNEATQQLVDSLADNKRDAVNKKNKFERNENNDCSRQAFSIFNSFTSPVATTSRNISLGSSNDAESSSLSSNRNKRETSIFKSDPS